MFEDLRKPMELITIVVALLSYGCPVQAIVHADRDWTNEPWRSGGIGLANTANRYMRNHAQYRLYRTFECHVPGATGEPYAQEPACGFPLAHLVHGHVPDWLYLQFLRTPPGTFEREALGKGMHSGSGQWIDRPCVEC